MVAGRKDFGGGADPWAGGRSLAARHFEVAEWRLSVLEKKAKAGYASRLNFSANCAVLGRRIRRFVLTISNK
jgi:hypothetical protein